MKAGKNIEDAPKRIRVRIGYVKGLNFRLPVRLTKIEHAGEDGEDVFFVEVDGVDWVATTNLAHAIPLFDMIRDHIAAYYHYEPLKKGND